MARDRTLPTDFWTWEAVIDCAPMTRLLFLGLWNFADDFGVQPPRPRTIRMQVFPGDEVGNDAVRAMIEELATRKLVRLYAVDGVEYVEIVDWRQMQRVGKRARRRYPTDASVSVGAVGEQPSRTMENHSNGEAPGCPASSEAAERPPRTIENQSNGAAPPEADVEDAAPADSAALPVGLALLGEGARPLDGVLAAGHGDESGVVLVAHRDLGDRHVERAHDHLLGGADAHR